MRWPARTRGLGTAKDSASVASSLSQEAMRRMSGRECGEDVVLLSGGKEKKRRGIAAQRPRRRRVFSLRSEGTDGDARADGFVPGDGAEGLEKKGAPGHEPDEEKREEEIERDSVVVAGTRRLR